MSESLFSMQWKWKGIFTVKTQKSIKALKSYHNINLYISCTVYYNSSEVIWLCEEQSDILGVFAENLHSISQASFTFSHDQSWWETNGKGRFSVT